MKKIILSTFLIGVLGVGAGVGTTALLSGEEVGANPIFKVDEVKNGVPFVNNVAVDPETGVPEVKGNQGLEEITKGHPKAKERFIILTNGVNGKQVAKVTYEEFLENQDYYNSLLDEATEEALKEKREKEE